MTSSACVCSINSKAIGEGEGRTLAALSRCASQLQMFVKQFLLLLNYQNERREGLSVMLIGDRLNKLTLPHFDKNVANII